VTDSPPDPAVRPAPDAPDAAAASACSGHRDTRTAADEVAASIHDELEGRCDLLLIFASFHHGAAIVEAVESMRTMLQPGASVAVTAESVVSTGRELEGLPGISALGLRLPGATVTPWIAPPDDPIPISRPDEIPERIGFRHDTRAILMFGDPFSTPITRLLPALDSAAAGVPILGGMASGASQPGHNVLIVDDRATRAGVVGVTLGGAFTVDTLVSQGCRPIGEPLVVTRTDDEHTVRELGGHPATEMVERMAADLPPHERQLLGKGLLVGHVIDETRRPFGRGDFLVRAIVGTDPQKKSIMMSDRVRPGQTVQFHARDAVTAGEDLQLLLDAEQLRERPFAGLLFTCNGRGERLFETADYDTSIIEDRLGPLPLTGFMAAGEIGPIGGHAFLHGQTAVLGLFRATAPEAEDHAEAAAEIEVEIDPPALRPPGAAPAVIPPDPATTPDEPEPLPG
jgi:small ligand-binding sensory domain FIST